MSKETRTTPLLSVELITSFVASFEAKDLSSKELFLSMFNHLKGYKDNKPRRLELVKQAKAQIVEATPNEAIVRRASAIFMLAEKYISLKAFTHIDSVYMYNLEGVIKTLEYMLHNHPSDSVKVANKLSRVFKSNYDKVTYNNKLADKIIEIRKEYNIFDVDGKFVTLKKNLVKLVAELSAEQIAELHALTAPKASNEALEEETTPTEG